MRPMVIFLIAPLLLGAPAVLAQDANKPAEPAKKAKPDPNRQVCKTIHSVGSLIPRKLCKTAREWEQEEELAQDVMKRGRQEGVSAPN